MPPGGPEYTLVGFSDQLDWRPLHFVKPIPANRICSACGIVRRTTALLPCMHVLCECCYEQCAQDGGRVCPLDGHRCQGGDVDWKESAVEEILGRKVSCWNEENGCKAMRFVYNTIEPRQMCLSGGGFFAINARTLMRLAEAVVTYSVILIQTGDTVIHALGPATGLFNQQEDVIGFKKQ
ncbi:hypothetical protein V5799_015051 [Amblyomma americanum]|uniref:RING-type domain-containing protein n=1 Tax=Amblyomma americanum TaxID=6943 RepID=A0AAQ4E195_AMBAM